MNTNEVAGFPECRWCGLRHNGRCITCKSIEYFEDGVTVKRVEFYTPADYCPPNVNLPSPQNWRDIRIT